MLSFAFLFYQCTCIVLLSLLHLLQTELQSLIDFMLAITLIESPCVISAFSDQAWHDLKLTTLGKRIVNRLK